MPDSLWSFLKRRAQGAGGFKAINRLSRKTAQKELSKTPGSGSGASAAGRPQQTLSGIRRRSHEKVSGKGRFIMGNGTSGGIKRKSSLPGVSGLPPSQPDLRPVQSRKKERAGEFTHAASDCPDRPNACEASARKAKKMGTSGGTPSFRTHPALKSNHAGLPESASAASVSPSCAWLLVAVRGETIRKKIPGA